MPSFSAKMYKWCCLQTQSTVKGVGWTLLSKVQSLAFHPTNDSAWQASIAMTKKVCTCWHSIRFLSDPVLCFPFWTRPQAKDELDAHTQLKINDLTETASSLAEKLENARKEHTQHVKESKENERHLTRLARSSQVRCARRIYHGPAGNRECPHAALRQSHVCSKGYTNQHYRFKVWTELTREG